MNRLCSRALILGSATIGIGALLGILAVKSLVLSFLIVVCVIGIVMTMRFGVSLTLSLAVPVIIVFAPDISFLNYAPMAAPLFGLLVLAVQKNVREPVRLPVFASAIIGVTALFMARDMISAVNANTATLAEVMKQVLRSSVPASALVFGLMIGGECDTTLHSKMKRLLVALAVVQGLIGIVQVYGPAWMVRIWALFADKEKYLLDGIQGPSRALGTIGNPNYFGVMMGLGLILLAHEYFSHERRGFVSFYVPVMILCIALLLSGSRSAVILLLAAGIPEIPRARSLLLVLVPAVWLLVRVPMGRSGRILEMLKNPRGALSFGYRATIWQSARRSTALGDLPLFGVGQAGLISRWGQAVDSEYVRVLILYGIVGLVMFVGTMALCIRHAKSLTKTERTFAVMLLTYLAANCLTSELLSSVKMGPLCCTTLGLMLSACAYRQSS